MKNIILIFNVILFCIFSNSGLFSQSFQNEVLIDIPGSNYDFDLLSLEYYPYPNSESYYITWINKNNSVYSVYLKKISPEMGDNIIISSDYEVKSNPKIAYGQRIKIAWQNYTNEYYQIISCEFFDDSLSTKTIIQDSLAADPQISLCENRIAWIDNGRLFIKNVYPNLSNSILIDSSSCSSPSIANTKILYEKEENGNRLIYLASYRYYPVPQWNYEIISDGHNQNPNLGMFGGIAFEKFDQGVWKICYSYPADLYKLTKNKDCNYNNPFVFSYPITTGSMENKTPFFITFDTDSLENNNEIFINTFIFGTKDSLINISNMEGNDYEPKVTTVSINDTFYVSIIWIHEQNSKYEIWIAKEVYNPILGSVNDKVFNSHSFYLLQNYPNPFNPFTNIEYHIRKTSKVSLEIYDVLGKKIMTLTDGTKQPGIHKIIINGNNLASGIYFYTLNIEGITKTKSMILMR